MTPFQRDMLLEIYGGPDGKGDAGIQRHCDGHS